MNCDNVNDLLVEYVLDELDEKTRLAIATHLQHGCADCLALEQEILEGMDSLMAAIPDDPITAEHRSLIIANVAKATSATLILRSSANGLPNPNDCSASNAWAGYLPCFLSFAAGIMLMALVFPLRDLNLSVERAPEVMASSQSNSFAVNPATVPTDSEISVDKRAKTLFVSMKRLNESSKIKGHIVWDTLNHEVHFFGTGIATPPSGMHYVLWLTDQNNHPLATKELILDNEGTCKATVASTIFDVRYVFMTLESKLAGITQPSSNLYLSQVISQ